MKTPKSSSNSFTFPLLILSSIASTAVLAQDRVFIPDSSIEKPEDLGKGRHAHTHYRMMITAGSEGNTSPAISLAVNPDTAPYPGYTYQTPASIACIYSLVADVTGCNPNTVTSNVLGGSKAIAIVDAYDYPHALEDLQTFSTQFGLPSPKLQVVYASGTQPVSDPFGWEVEEALDLQWAHALAPNAQLYLVEAASSSINDMLKALSVANTLVAAAKGGEVSMSWGHPSFPVKQPMIRILRPRALFTLPPAGMIQA